MTRTEQDRAAATDADVVVRVEHVSKRFSRSLKHAMLYGLQDIGRAVFLPGDSAAARRREESLRPGEFWALSDVSFQIRRGECVGLIGPNGAGKSTLFKVISGIWGPTGGRVEVNGRLTALIEVGAGFHPMLTGRENIFISGAVLGMSEQEIRDAFDDIVEFSGVGDFIDMPVKFYSSGMHVRLGFSIIAHLNPQIMLLDEILAVGDLAFQRKCLDWLEKLRRRGMAVGFVSHSLYQIESLCDRVVWVDHGRVVMEGATRDVVRAYRDHEIAAEREARQKGAPGRPEPAKPAVGLTVHNVVVLDERGRPASELSFGRPFRVRISYTAADRIERPLFNLRFIAEGASAFEAAMLVDGRGPEHIEGPGYVDCVVPAPRLLPKNYDVVLFVRNREGVVDLVEPGEVASFSVVSGDLLQRVPSAGPYALGHLMTGGLVYVDYEWSLEHAVEVAPRA